jgi:hypothetical protein
MRIIDYLENDKHNLEGFEIQITDLDNFVSGQFIMDSEVFETIKKLEIEKELLYLNLKHLTLEDSENTVKVLITGDISLAPKKQYFISAEKTV